MSEETTRDMPDGRSFETRVFARFDSLDARMDSFDERVGTLEIQVERRALETKPIWERALAEIGEGKERLSSLEEISTRMLRKVNVLNQDMLTMRADQLGLETRIEKLEPANP